MDKELINSREFAKRVVSYRTDRNIQTELQAIHYEIFKKYFRVNCGSCIKKAYTEIRSHINNELVITKQSKQMSQFKLKTGASGLSKQIHINHDVITNDNLTDEKAIEILRKHPAHIATFGTFPANWQELLSAKKQAPAPSDLKIESGKKPNINTESKKTAAGKK